MSVQFERVEKNERKKGKENSILKTKRKKNMTPCYVKNIKLLLLLSRLIIDLA